jgi:hypothetical protein
MNLRALIDQTTGVSRGRTRQARTNNLRRQVRGRAGLSTTG